MVIYEMLKSLVVLRSLDEAEAGRSRTRAAANLVAYFPSSPC